MDGMVLVRTTLESEGEARDLCRRLVEHRLACCVHRWRIDSTYEWDGEVQEDEEWIVEARTPAHRAEELWSAIEEAHPYDTPVLESIAVARTADDYGSWAEQVTS